MPLMALVAAYRLLIRPLLIGGGCRFHPSCSEYAMQALARHGAIRGGWLTIKRLVRCRPGVIGGYDPVP